MCKYLKGQCHEIFDYWFFHESVSHKPLSIPLGPFRIFSKIRGDIRSSRCTTGVVDVEKIFKLKIFNYFVWTPDIVPIICHPCHRYQWQFATSVVDTGGKFLLVSLTPVANLPPVSTTLAKLVEKFAAGVVDTGDKFATSVNRWCTLTCEYLCKFSKTFETKNLVTLSLLQYSM
jgi:hypothetical protein